MGFSNPRIQKKASRSLPEGGRWLSGDVSQAVNSPLASACVWALALFAVLNLSFTLLSSGSESAAAPGEHGWTYWSLADFARLKEAPTLVFLGSSLMLVPLAGTDADYLGHRLDSTAHHHSAYLERVLSDRTGKEVTTFNFALPGEMPSDACFIVHNLLKGNRAPKVIVYGVGPRDLIDNLLPGPASTDPYRYLSRLGGARKYADWTMSDMFQRLSFEISQILYLYDKRNELAAGALRQLSFLFAQLMPTPGGCQALSTFERRKLLPDYKAQDVEPGEAYFRPRDKAEQKTLTDNLEEYRKRYKSLRWQTFITQAYFLNELARICKDRSIQLVLVTMPITDMNKALLRQYAFNAYKRTIRAVACAHGATFLDLVADKSFTTSDFGDTVHLHSGGGKKLLDRLVEGLLASQRVKLKLGLPVSSVAESIAGRAL